ncbi:hypothetical protein PP175_26480 (plasmid) [Aneurinibacillus sp. Ricciae_BoGa-3]|uniref:hypothetical protein n=1 Tax=Aneurinibacillus sp. Ricciae_BoGa-3 TaxID=3022697 RepID=UPI002341A6CA|nr:hypothetical protein [Aneurinibacillus sp. Ricciae_BoGa-3]WCK57612.1 hypothetical protein PP175_26480 [Aneurinibacillus sp. Ricciae_BoGa-3]
MQVKVLATLEWHEGIPDGKQTVSFVIPEFDIANNKEAWEIGLQLLIEYGVQPETIKDIETYNGSLQFSALMGRFDQPLAPHATRFTTMADVEITYDYVWEHRGKVYELNELSNQTVIPMEKNFETCVKCGRPLTEDSSRIENLAGVTCWNCYMESKQTN